MQTNCRCVRPRQVFINYDDNHQLDSKGMIPFGRLVDGMSTVTSIYSGYDGRGRLPAAPWCRAAH